MYEKALIISRYHDDFSNPIYNAYVRGIQSQCRIIRFVDYFDQIHALGKKGFELQIENMIKKEEIELIFFIFVSGDPTLDPYFIQNIAKNKFIVMVFWDVEQFYEQIDRYYAQLADLVILPANYEYVYKLESMGVNAICPFSLFDSTKYRTFNKGKKEIDVSFVGEVTKGKRKEYIEYLEKNGINIESYGVGTKNGKVSFEKVVEIFNNSKINLSFTGMYENEVYSYCLNINNRIRQNKGKPIEISLCGGFVLTEYVSGIEKVFNSADIDTFLTKEELLCKVQFYLNNHNLREEMAKRAYKHAVKNYDSIEAFKIIFNKIYQIKPKIKKDLILDEIFLKVHATFHLYYFLTFLINKRFKFAIEEIKYFFKYKKVIYKDLYIFIRYALRNKKEVKRTFKKESLEIFRNLEGKELIIYGGGNHTLLLFKQFKILRTLNIRIIVDKDKSKWGMKINGILIVSPEEILNYGNHIIISSYKYNNEIKKELEKKYSMEDLIIHDLYQDKYNNDMVSADAMLSLDAYQNYRNCLVNR